MKLSKKEEKEWYEIQETLMSIPDQDDFVVFIEYLKDLPHSKNRFPILFQDPTKLILFYQPGVVTFAISTGNNSYDQHVEIENEIHFKLF